MTVEIPAGTCDTVVRVRGVSRCGKVPHRTRTRATHFGNTAGFPIPVPIPTHDASFTYFLLFPQPLAATVQFGARRTLLYIGRDYLLRLIFFSLEAETYIPI